MGMDLSYDYKILNEQEYGRLKCNGLYFTNKYNLNLIDAFEAEDRKKIAMFNAIEYKIEQEGTNWIKDLQYNAETYNEDMFELVKDYIELDDLPITLEQWLNEDETDGYEIREINEEELNGQKIYLLIHCRFW